MYWLAAGFQHVLKKIVLVTPVLSTAVQDQIVLFIPGLRLVESEAVTLP